MRSENSIDAEKRLAPVKFGQGEGDGGVKIPLMLKSV